MSATLKSLSNALSQLTSRPGMSCPAGVWVSGALALALVAGAPERAYANEAGTERVEQPAAQLSPEAERNVGRAIGGVLGFVAARAADANGVLRVGATAIGAAIGGEVVRGNQNERGAGAAAAGQKTGATAADRFLSAGAGAPAAGKRSLNPQLQTRMASLVVEASAARLVAQELYTVFERAEMDAATQPGNAQARAKYQTARDELQRGVQVAGAGLANLRNAVSVAGQQGYDTTALDPVVKELSTLIDHRSRLSYSAPQIFARAEVLQKSHASLVGVDVLAQAAQANEAPAQAHRSRNATRP